MGPSASSRLSEKSRANTSTVNTRACRVRRVESASWCGSWPWAVRMMKLSTPASSQDPSRSFIQRCSVLRRTEALPGKGRLVAVLTPYSIVGARRISSAADRSSARRSTMMVSQPSGRWGPCCSHVPTGTRRRASRSRMKRTSSGTRGLRCSGALTWRSRAAPRPSPPPSGCTGARRPGRGRRARRAPRARLFSRPRLPPPPPPPPPVAWAGRHRFVPARDTAELRAVITPFYVSLEARRQTLDGGSAVGTVLLDAVPAAPDRDRAVSAQFEAGYGVALRFYTPGLAPREPDVFDYCPISCERGDTLFSVQPVPPSQGDAKLAALRGATQRGGAALAVALVLLALVAPAGRWRWLLRLAQASCAGAGPLGSSVLPAGGFLPPALFPPPPGGVSAAARAAIPGWGGGGCAPRAPRGGCGCGVPTGPGPSGTPSCGSPPW